jgi:hypothetical protein
MRSIEAVLSLSLGLGIAGGVLAQYDAPLLLPPSSEPSQPAPKNETSSTVGPTPAPDRSSVLALPGLRRPTPPRARAGIPSLEPAGPSSPSDLPPLVGPSEMPATTRNSDRSSRLAPEARGRTMVLESVPSEEMSEAPTQPTTPLRRDPSRPVTPTPRTGAPTPKTVAPPPRRAPSFFGRMFPAPANASRAESDSSIKVEPSTDPASDAAVKRRIEHQIRQTYGDRLGSVEVRVVGRDVTIRGRANRFWQKRNLKRSLESMSSLSGLRPTIEVD